MFRLIRYLYRYVRNMMVLSPEDLKAVLKDLSEIPSKVDLCNDVVAALEETNGTHIRRFQVLSCLLPTDYERSKKQIRKICRRAGYRIYKLRRSAVSADAIRAQSYIDNVRKCCRTCERINRQRIKQGKKFSCLIRETFKQNSENDFRFKLDKAGQIIEKIR